jgi:DNA-binding XRE family transcriptional regulator
MVRKVMGMSQADMARKLDVNAVDLYILERNKRKVGFNKVQDYCKALGLTMVLVPDGMLGKLMDRVVLPVMEDK